MQNHFNGTKQFLALRNNDINIMLSHMDSCKKAVDSTIFKSSIMLMLYNEIEGTFSNVLSELFDYIIDENIDFDILHSKIKNVYLEYYNRKIANNLAELLNFRNNPDLKSVGYLELNKYLKLYSGNLDARQIREISKRLGVPISNEIIGDNLVKIKNCRNRLAHGEISFQEACRNYTENEIYSISNETFAFLDMVLKDYNNFVCRQIIRG